MRPAKADRARLRALLCSWFAVVTIFLPPTALLYWIYFGRPWNQQGWWLQACNKQPHLLSHNGCELAGIIIVAAGIIGTFGLILLIWWRRSQLHGLKSLFELPWSGLDDVDVESAGAVESLVRAAVFVLIVWLCAAAILFAVNSAYDAGNIHFMIKKRDAPKPCTANEHTCRSSETNAKTIDGLSTSMRELVRAIEAQTRIQRSLIEGSAKITSIMAETNAGLERGLNKQQSALEAQTRMQQHLLEDGSTKITKLLEQTNSTLETGLSKQQSATEDGLAKVAKPLAQIATTIASTPKVSDAFLDALDRIRQSIDRALQRPVSPIPVPTTRDNSCFFPTFKTNSDRTLQSLRARADVARLHHALPDGARYRAIANHLVFFDTDRTDLSDGAKASLAHFLGPGLLGNLALSVRALADRQGRPPYNEQLSQKRAIAVAKYMMDEHRYPPVVDLNWFGEDNPTQPSADGRSEPYNRIARVQVLQLCQ